MKKYRFACILILFCLLSSLVLPAARAAEPSTTGSGSALLDSMHIDAAAAILIDAGTGEVLYEQDAHAQRFPASITKVMTCMLTIEAIDRGELSLDDAVTISGSVQTGIGEGGSTQSIQPGEILTIRDLLYCALVPSANEACNALAEKLTGNIPAFVDLMNQRAAELGMKDTHFANTHGYHNPDHYTTAYDISLMCREAMKHPIFRQIVSSKSYSVPATNLHAIRNLHSTNALVSTWLVRGYYYSDATGIKTGSTPEAGYCLASSATQGDKDLIAVVMGAKSNRTDAGSNYFSESSRLLKWGFENFTLQTILSQSEVDIAEIPVTLSSERNYVTVHPAETIQVTVPKDMDIASFERKLNLPDSLEAPIEKDQVLGTITITYRDKTYGTINLLANDSLTRSELLYYLDRAQKFFSQTWVKVLLVVLGLAVVVLLVCRAVFGKRRSRYGSRRSKVYSGARYTGTRRRR